MRKINKIIIFFFILSFSTIYGGWVFIHSEKFSIAASKKISDILVRKVGAKLSFERVAFSMFPPSTTFKNVKLLKENSDKFNIDLSLSEFSVNFTYLSFLSSNLEIDELNLKDGRLNLNIPENKNEPDIDWKKVRINELFSKYAGIYSQSPVKLNLLRLDNIDAKINEVDLKVQKLVLAPHKRNIRLKAEASDIVINKELPNIKLRKIENLKIQALADKEKLVLDEVVLGDGLIGLGLKGELSQDKQYINTNLKFNSNLYIESINKYFSKPIVELDTFSGKVDLSGEVSSRILDPDLNVKIKIANFKSPYAELQSVEVGANKKKSIISVTSFEAKNANEYYKGLKGAPLFDLSSNEFIKTRGLIEVKNAFTNTFLHTIKDSLDVFKGYLSGKVEVVFDGQKVNFVILEKAQLKDFKLLLKNSKKPLLQNPGFSIFGTTVSVDAKGTVGLDAKVEMPDSLLKLNGVIDSKSISIILNDSKINLKSFGPISGVQLDGSGPIDLKIAGPMNDVRFDFNVNWKKFGLIDLHFGDVKSHFVLSLADIMLSIDQLTGKYNSTNYNANGWLKFGDESGLDIKLDFPETSFSDAKGMYDLVFHGMKLPSDLGFKFETKYRVFGDFALDDLKLEGKFKGKELRVFGEDFDSFNFGLTLNNKNLNINSIKIKKGRGEISGTTNITLGNNYTEIDANGSGIRLSDFNFYKKFNLSYDSDLSLEYDGNGTNTNYSSRLKFKTIDPFIASFPASNSNGLIYLSNNELVAKLNLLAGKVKLDSILDFPANQIVLKGNVETNDLRELFGAISAHNITDKTIVGSVKANLNTKFNSENFNISKFNMDVKQFKLKREDVELKVDPNRNSILVEDGIVKKWDLYFVDGADYFSSKGKNSADMKAIILDQNFSIKSEVLELVNSFIEKSRGTIKGTNQILVNNGVSFNNFKINSNNASIKFKNIPGFISNLNYEITKNSNRFEINKLIGKYGEGDFRAGGYLVFDNLYPSANVDFKIDKSIIPLFKKSNIVVSGAGIITGSSLPYNLNGKISLLQGEILDDPNDIVNQNKITLDEYNKYLPNKNDASATGYINLNVNFDTLKDIVIKNNMAEVYLKAQGQLNGSVLSPEINTVVNVTPTTSKFKFKGHDFILSQGNVEIRDKGKTRTSSLKFLGNAKVNDYDIKLDVTGTVEKPEIALLSDQLRQEDILSLLTIGVTSDINKNLDPTERSSIQRIQFTSLLLNQTKLNEDINNTIGVNVSVLPEFESEESSLVESGKAASSSSSSNKIKSTTKIKINKKITSKLDVGVSSTIGGSIEQTQQMNANYNFGKNLSLEGVYEVKPSEDESTTTPASYGVDLKWKWSF